VGVHLAVLEWNAELRRECQALSRPAHFAGSAVSTEGNIIRRRIPFVRILKRVEENRDAPGNTHFLGRVVRVGHCEPPCRAAPSQRRRTRVLQDEGEAVGAVAQSALLRQPELEGSVKAGSHVLLFQHPDRSRSIFSGRR
jgi:hypothetical protein